MRWAVGGVCVSSTQESDGCGCLPSSPASEDRAEKERHNRPNERQNNDQAGVAVGTGRRRWTGVPLISPAG